MPAYSRILLPWDSQPQGVISGNSEHLYAPYLADAWNIDSKAFVGAFRGTKGEQAGTGTALALKTTGGGIGVYAPSTSASLKLTSSLSIGTADYFAQVTFTAANYYSLGSGINVIAGYGKGWGIAGLWIYLDSSSAFTVSMDAGATTVSRAALTVGRTYTATVFSIGSVAYAYLDGVLLGTASKTTPNETGNAGFYVAADEPLVNSALRSYAGAIHAAAVGIGTLNSGVAAFAGSYPWQLFAPRSIPIPVSAGGGGISLVIADSAHAHAADNIGLTLDTYLALQDALHAHSADNLGLTLDTYLAVNEALHAHTADNLTLSTTGATNLTVADAAHAHAADNLGLTLDTYLTIAEALHAHSADNLTLSTGAVANLVIADGAHAHAADNLAFTLDTWLAIADALHAHGADNLILTLLSNLAIADATHAHTADNVVLAFPLGALSDAEFRQMYDWLNELVLIHGLIAASPMTVTPTTRSAGAVSQTIGEVGTTITVTRT